METDEKTGTPLSRKIIAAVVLAVAAYVLFHIVLGFVTAIGGFLLIVIAGIALFWAISVLF
jgi:UPF0716 family protein affecting phage T7 exclusion